MLASNRSLLNREYILIKVLKTLTSIISKQSVCGIWDYLVNMRDTEDSKSVPIGFQLTTE
jgi:hypothetical protein